MKTEIILCDDCKKTLAETKCEFCDCDICIKCKTGIRISAWERNISSITTCQNCYDKYNEKLYKEAGFGIDINDKIKNFILIELKKKFMLENLKEKK